MEVLVTGSAGHLGRALVVRLAAGGHRTLGLDIVPAPGTDVVGSITDRELVRRCLDGVDVVLHTATLHKPHVVTHSRHDFVATNVDGTLTLLEAAVEAGVRSFVFTSTTSTFGRALNPEPGAPAVWVTEDLVPVPRNIYGVTKVAAEGVAELVHRDHGLPVVVLRTSRFFPEADDQRSVRDAFDDANTKVNELLHRRVDIDDIVAAHLLAAERAPAIGFGRYLISATTPFGPGDLAELGVDAPAVVARLVPEHVAEYERRGWRVPPTIGRVYVNERARTELGWAPRWDFARAIQRLAADEEPTSDLTRAIGANGYHAETFGDGPYPVR